MAPLPAFSRWLLMQVSSFAERCAAVHDLRS
jgi:hypothetical protein